MKYYVERCSNVKENLNIIQLNYLLKTKAQRRDSGFINHWSILCHFCWNAFYVPVMIETCFSNFVTNLLIVLSPQRKKLHLYGIEDNKSCYYCTPS